MTELEKQIQDLMKEIENLRGVIKKWEQCHQLDQAEIVRLRRQIEFLIGNDNP